MLKVYLLKMVPAGLVLAVALMVFVGCSDEDHPLAAPPERIGSPDDVMDAFTAALEAMDLEAMIPLLDQDTQHFSFRFREQDVENLSLPTDYLNRGDMISVWRNIFSGDEILNHAGERVPGITGIEVTRFDRNTDWCDLDCGTDSWWDIQYNLKRVNFRIAMKISRAGDLPSLNIEGNLEVRVRPPCSAALFADDCEGFALFDMVDGSWDGDSDHQVSLGEFLYSYFTNDAPVAVLAAVSNEDNHLLVEASACTSTDSGEPSLDLSYSWRTQADGIWTVGSERCSRSFEFSEFGEWTIEVEVQDRWGLSAHDQVTITMVQPSDRGP